MSRLWCSASQPTSHGFVFALLLIASFATVACSGTRPIDLGPSDQGLKPCPSSPNCVSSFAADPEHFVSPFVLVVPPEQAWKAVQEVVTELPRTTIVVERPNYLHAECKSRIFRFVDDLEIELNASEGLIYVRSASRLGESDMGVNRERVNGIRDALRQRGVLD